MHGDHPAEIWAQTGLEGNFTQKHDVTWIVLQSALKPDDLLERNLPFREGDLHLNLAWAEPR